MTGQELRRELAQVNFGVKPTDREVPDTLAKGIIRFIANRKGLTIDVDAIGIDDESEEREEKEESNEEMQTVAEDAGAKPQSSASPSASAKPESYTVMRKLTLEDVSKAAIKRQEQVLRKDEPRDAHALRAPARAKTSVAQRDQEQIKKKDGPVTLPDMITVKELAEKTGIQVSKIIQALMKNGVMATITQSIDFDTAAIVAAELGVIVEREERTATAEELFSRNLRELTKDEPQNLRPRPPIVVIMGHVDHGKTSLLDSIRSSDVAKNEAGGITQHIGAYQVEHVSSLLGPEPRKITFLDTPGHEAFTAMRARGAQVTDIVILVVSAEEGVKATTIEAIHHAKDAEVPIIVAITKIDKERADIERVKGEMAAQGLQPEDWGGTVPYVPCSAVTKQGVSDLLDHLLLIAEEKKLSANPARAAIATIIESKLDTAFGPLATVLVNTGTLRVGDVCVCGHTVGRAKALIDAHGKRLPVVEPSGAARLSGLEEVPAVGDILQVVGSDKEARALVEALAERKGAQQKRKFADLVARLSEGKLKHLKVVLKADAQGSLEAIQEALNRMTSGATEVSVKVIHGAVGAVSESDVMMAAASEGVVLAFHTSISGDVRRTAEREGVHVQEYEVLYALLDDVDRLVKGLVEPVEEEKVLGHLEIRAVFFREKSEQIVGGKVLDGIIKRLPIRVMRDGQLVGEGRISSLKHVDKDIKEAKEGQECGMKLDIGISIQEKDVLEVYQKELKKKE